MSRVVVAVSIGLLLLVGCSSRSDAEKPSDSTVDHADTGPGINDDPALAYVELVTPFNCAYTNAYSLQQDILYDGVGVDEQNWDEVQSRLMPAYTAAADASMAFSAQLSEASWPPEAQPSINALVTQLDEGAVLLRSMAASASIADFVDRSVAYVDLRRASDPAADVRNALGLDASRTKDIAPCPAPA